MRIYYNPAYTASPFRTEKVEFGNHYCGDIQLLQKLLFYAGVPYNPEAEELRVAQYYASMVSNISEESIFYKSFKTDSVGMTKEVLSWRDALVAVGYDVKNYNGDSIKLSLIKAVEPNEILLGEADYWNLLLQIVTKSSILPNSIDIVITCSEEQIKPHIAFVFSELSKKGVNIEYKSITTAIAEGNLRLIQNAILNQENGKIALNENDETFTHIKFSNEDEVLRYVASLPVDNSSIYYCSKPKRFDNTLKLLEKPTVGSSSSVGMSQVSQLFITGNSLFECPLNIKSIIDWLNMPISPIDNGLRKILRNAIINSGGIKNEECEKAKQEYLDSKEEKERKKILEQCKKFLPISENNQIDIKAVKNFNEELKNWAIKLISMDKEDFPYNDVVRGQISTIISYCSSLLNMLESAPSDFKYLDLILWCKNIQQPSKFVNYEAEVGGHNTICSMGDIHDCVEKVVWVMAEDEGKISYPFDMLNEHEYEEAEKYKAKLYTREKHTLIYQTSMLRMLLNTKRLEIIEADKSNGAKVSRHPLVLQLNEIIEGGLKKISQCCAINEEYIETGKQINNISEDPILVQLDSDIKLKERYECYKEEERQAESYSSLIQLIEHPFSYVCDRYAKLKDREMPSAQDKERTLGNVAHLIIEKVFSGRKNEEYETIFEEAVNEKGLLLRLPEYAIDLRRLKIKMKNALEKLKDIISKNKLTVDACEYKFKVAEWNDAGEDVKISSRADMLLSDSKGGKVIFDFKYTKSGKYYKEMIEENIALQLEYYRFMTQREFGEKTLVRVAYVLLPEVDIITADKFVDVEQLEVKERGFKDIMLEAANSYRYRWQQLKEGKIERVEGTPKGTGLYDQEQNLFPLSSYNGVYNEDKFNKDFKSLR